MSVSPLSTATCTVLAFLISAQALQETAPGAKAATLSAAQLFHQRASGKMGLLIPLYIYPADIYTNKDYNRVMELKRKYPEVPFWVIMNPASGPGIAIDANYTKAIDRLIGAGCVVLGYVPTNYGKIPLAVVRNDLELWRTMYPRVQGIFFDEMIYDDNTPSVAHQLQLNEAAHQMGYWPTVANPGTNTPGRYFSADAADVIVIHEGKEWPTEAKLHGNYFGGYSDFPPHTRAALMYGQEKFDTAELHVSRRYIRWVYVTQDTYEPNSAAHPNPWDELSVHLETLCQKLAE